MEEFRPFRNMSMEDPMREVQTKWYRLIPVAIDQIRDMLFNINTPPKVKVQLIEMVLAYTRKEEEKTNGSI